ncbi:ABC transporter substrate-binding protein [Konateibacter massiliensis]|uniref:ABC transporter substrate-binding protein n=1 Tax=Konateibacter massiliensis TaxID=2002841 RepID=UPI000C1611DD|nr:extracellular solute-binding protein [Konateibacter massiliensis]
MKKLKRITAMLMAVTMIASLTACGGKTSTESTGASTGTPSETTTAADTNTQSADASEEPINLRFMWWGGDERAQATLEVIKKFQEENPNITIEAESLSSDGYQEKLTTQLTSGTAADIIQIDPAWMPGYVKSGGDYFVDYNHYSNIVDLTTFDADFLKNNGNFDGNQYGLPTGLAGTALIYNTELAKKVGIEFKEDLTWDDLIEMGKKVQAYDSNMYLLTVGETLLVKAILKPYLQQLTGNKFFVDETNEMGFTQEELTQALDYIKALYDNNVIAPISGIISYGDELQNDPKWISGDTYIGMFCYSSTAKVATAAAPEQSFAASNLPKMENAKDDGFYCNCPQYMAVNNKSANVEAAMKFLEYFYNNQEAAEILGTVRSIPATSVGQKICVASGQIEGITKETVDIAQQYRGTLDLGLSTEEEAITIQKEMADQVAYGVTSPEDAAASSIALFQNYLDSKK